MGQNPFKTKAFKLLKNEWDKVLEKAGFKDAEKADPKTGEPRLKAWDSHYFHARHFPESFEAKSEYYYQCFHFLHSYNFKSKTDRQVWELHTQGQGLRIIATVLKSQGVETNKDYVATTVNRLKALMKKQEATPLDEQT